MMFNERLPEKLDLMCEEYLHMTVLHVVHICMNAEECLPTSRTIPSQSALWRLLRWGGTLTSWTPNSVWLSSP